MRKINPAYADLVVDKSDEDAILHPIFGSQHDILAPPEVTVEDRVLHDGESATPCIIYPVPSDWWPYVTDEGHWELLREVGWQSRQDTSPLLNSFLNLAELADKGITEGVRKQVATFAKQWGPLWLCATPNHTAGIWAGPCYWGSLSPYWNYTQSGKPCAWCPAEEVTTWLRKAQQARAVIEAAKCVQEDHAIPEPVRQHLVHPLMSDDLSGPIQGCVLVSFTINENLVNLNGPGVQFQWLPDAEPKLDILSGVGFIHTVWFQIAQAVCSLWGFKQCVECKTLFTLEERHRKFCERCGKKASNRRSAKRRRDLEHQAQQLHAEGFTDEAISQQLKPKAGRIKVNSKTVQKWVR